MLLHSHLLRLKRGILCVQEFKTNLGSITKTSSLNANYVYTRVEKKDVRPWVCFREALLDPGLEVRCARRMGSCRQQARMTDSA